MTAQAGQIPVTMPPDERRALLAQRIAVAVRGGARVESQSDYQAVVVSGHRVNHVLHFLIGLLTIGLWWIVWVALAIFGGEKRQMIQVDDWGNVRASKV
jgi:hypothetical protein